MDTDSESVIEQDMISSANSSRASTPTPREDIHSSCMRRKEIEKDLKTYTNSIDHCQTLIRNLERQGLFDHPIYTTQCAMTQEFKKQRELMTANSSIAPTHQSTNPKARTPLHLSIKFFDPWFFISTEVPPTSNRWRHTFFQLHTTISHKPSNRLSRLLQLINLGITSST
ncbi:hypothetical protein NPIL_200261 [Nephila pilipes]|uniref:Uncharacterized protein n=1 Tax=Nephila pilipes TaxID=299642 RepID=A0A8X6UG35_NEPPI|nr:hypothetical protein NPIL_200261 [Nephila pilipes]